MTKAASSFRIAQTALGLQMRQLEQFLGSKILERHSRGVVPTPAGQLLYERAQEILQLVEETVESVQNLQGKSSILTLGLIPSQMQLLAQELLTWTKAQNPLFSLRLIEEFRPHEAVRRGEVDFGIGCEVPHQPDIERTPLLTEELIFITAPQHFAPTGVDDLGLADETIDMADVLSYQLTFSPHATEMWRLVEAAARSISAIPRVAFEVQSIQGIKMLVASGAAASVLPYGSIRTELADGRLVGRRVRHPGLRWTIYWSTPKRALARINAEQHAFLLDHILECLLVQLGPLATRLWTPCSTVAPASPEPVEEKILAIRM